MDKETLSNYGWIVICVLVLAVMLALATPFGTFIADGFKATYTGLFDTGDSALDVGLSAVGVTNTLECGHGRKESGDHAQLGCGHFACEDCGCVPASCGIEGHWATDGKNHAIDAICGNHTYECECDIWVVPADGRYTMSTSVNGKYTYYAGQSLPCGYVAKYKDKYVNAEYEYVLGGKRQTSSWNYDETQDGWGVYHLDKSNANPKELMAEIAGKPLLNINSAFYKNTAITDMSNFNIPDSVIGMNQTFYECSALVNAPVLPPNLENMDRTFASCLSLVDAPITPDSVNNMSQTYYQCTTLTDVSHVVIPSGVGWARHLFSGCTSLSGTITINISADVIDNNILYCFKDVDMTNITLTGSASKDLINRIGATGNNWTPIE